jgi:hypothetical protein
MQTRLLYKDGSEIRKITVKHEELLDMKLQRIETTNYILWVSLTPSKKGQLCYDTVDGTIFTKEYDSIPHPLTNDNPISENNYLPIIAYQPKNNAPELDLPLLPEMVVGDAVEKLAEGKVETVLEKIKDVTKRWFWKKGFVYGYKSATKVYSEDDVLSFLDLHTDSAPIEYLKSEFKKLKQPKTPKWFVAEIESACDYDFTSRCTMGRCSCKTKLKTTTINGKTYLIGKFIYE